MAIFCESLNLLYIQVPGTGCSVVAMTLQKALGGVPLGRKHSTVAELIGRNLIDENQLQHCIVFANVRNPFDRFVTYFQRYKGPWAVSEFLRVQEAALDRQIAVGTLSTSERVERAAQLKMARVRTHRRMRMFRWLGFNTWLWSAMIRWHRKSLNAGNGNTRFDRAFPMLERVDVAIRQETLEESLNTFLKRIGIGNTVSLPRRNLTQDKRPYPQYFNAATRWLVERLYGEDIAKMGYSFGESVFDAKPIPLTAKGRAFLQ